MEKFDIRPYQDRTDKAIREAVARGIKRILVVSPTGSGKGYMSARIIESAGKKGTHNMFLADQRELIKQLHKQCHRLGMPVTVTMAEYENEYDSAEDHHASAYSHLVSKDTLWSRAFKTDKIELPAAKVVQIDEAHRSISHTYTEIMKAYGESILIGWTATPCRGDNLDMGALYEEMIISARYDELQADGFLEPISRIIQPTKADLEGVKSQAGDYAKGQLQERMDTDKLIGDAVDEWRKNADGRQTVLFASGVDHSQHCVEAFEAIGVKAEHLDGKTYWKKREDILGRVADGITQVLCNYGVAHTGIDVPRWKYLVCLRPTRSFSLWRQMGGRIQRPWFGVPAMIQDHTDNTLEFGFPDEDVEWTLGSIKRIDIAHKEKKVREKTLPYRCGSCMTMYADAFCPCCGTQTPEKEKMYEIVEGELVEAERKAKNRKNHTTSSDEKQRFWDAAYQDCIDKDYRVGKAARMYQDEFGVMPTAKVIAGLPVSLEWKMKARDFAELVSRGENGKVSYSQTDFTHGSR